MKIAICDDNGSDISIIRDYVGRFDAGLTCAAFQNAEALLDALRTDFFDLIFLDIEMDALNGFDAAQLIMEGRDKPLIVFVTKSSKYTVRGYEVAFRYLVKPTSYEDFSQVMKAAMERIVPKKIAIDIGGKDHIFSVRDIYYFEIFGHRVRFVTADRSFLCRSSLKSIEDKLAGSGFVRPHNSYLVNTEHVATVTPTELVTKDGMRISISRKKKDETLRLIYQYLRR